MLTAKYLVLIIMDLFSIKLLNFLMISQQETNIHRLSIIIFNYILTSKSTHITAIGGTPGADGSNSIFFFWLCTKFSSKLMIILDLSGWIKFLVGTIKIPATKWSKKYNHNYNIIACFLLVFFSLFLVNVCLLTFLFR